jgi:transcriptional regulator with XRE-family HTH domain
VLSNKKIGERLRTIRRERGMTQAELADVLDTHFTSISQIERGQRGLTVQQLVKLASALNVTPNELLLNGKANPVPLSTRRSRILRRLQRLEELPQAEQKAILKILDGLLDRNNARGRGRGR